MNSIENISKAIETLEQNYNQISADECTDICFEAQEALAKLSPTEECKRLQGRIIILIERTAYRKQDAMQIKVPETSISALGAFLIFLGSIALYKGASRFFKNRARIVTATASESKAIFAAYGNFKPGLGGSEPEGPDRENRFGHHANESRDPPRGWSQDPRCQEAERLRDLGYEAYERSKPAFDGITSSAKDVKMFETFNQVKSFLNERDEAYQYFSEASRIESDIAQDAARDTSERWDAYMQRVREDSNITRDEPGASTPESCCIQ